MIAVELLLLALLITFYAYGRRWIGYGVAFFKAPRPLGVMVINASPLPVNEVTLFGANYNMFGNSGQIKNFNNPPDITITPQSSMLTYGQLLFNSQIWPLYVDHLIIAKTEESPYMCRPYLTIQFLNSCDLKFSYPVYADYTSEKNVPELTFRTNVKLDGNLSFIIGQIPPSETYIVTFVFKSRWKYLMALFFGKGILKQLKSFYFYLTKNNSK